MRAAFHYLSDIISLLGEDRKKLPPLLLLFLVVTLADVISISLISPYISLVMGSHDIDDNVLVQKISLLIGITTYHEALIISGITLVLIFCLKGVVAVGSLYLLNRFCWRQVVRLRIRLISAYQSMSFLDFVGRNRAEYLQSTQMLTLRYNTVLQVFLRLVCEGMVAVAILFYVWSQHGKELGFLLLLVSIVVLGYDRLVRRRVQLAGKISNIENAHAIARINENIDGFREIRILGKQLFFLKRIERASRKSAHNFFVAQTISSVPRYLFEVILVLFFVSLIVFSLDGSGRDLAESLPMFGLFGMVAVRLLPSATLVTTGLSKLRFGHQPIQTIKRDLALVRASERRKCLGNEKIISGAFERLELKNVGFQFRGRNSRCIEDVSLKICRGEMIGIVGQSGVGKTTLIDIMLGLIRPNEGKILVNGRDLKSCIDEWYDKVYYMSQDGFMVDGSIEENLTLGAIDGDETNSLLDEAISMAGLGQVLQSLPGGGQTPVGDRGGQLSGGQRQRVELARAFFHSREVFFLDEPTSALDPQTKIEVQRRISALRPERTVIIVSHDATLVQDCDRVYELKSGRLIQQE